MVLCHLVLPAKFMLELSSIYLFHCYFCPQQRFFLPLSVHFKPAINKQTNTPEAFPEVNQSWSKQSRVWPDLGTYTPAQWSGCTKGSSKRIWFLGKREKKAYSLSPIYNVRMLSLKFRWNLIFINMKLNFHRKKTLRNSIEELSNQENGRAYFEDHKLLFWRQKMVLGER